MEVFFVESTGKLAPLETKETTLPCEGIGSVSAGGEVVLDLSPWKYSLFDSFGTYEVRVPETETAARFEVYEPGVMTQVFRTFVTKPLLNLLVLIASLLPGYNLGIAIILLTLLVKLVLFLPTQHAMEGQKKLQAIQPQLDAIKKKYKDDPQRMQQETMKIWKQEKVNPLQSCLPMLIQFPILIGVFFVIRDGSVLELSKHLLYAPYQELPWTFGTQFLWFDLLRPSIYIMPPTLMILQFVQMKLSFAISERKKAGQEKIIDVGKKKEKPSQQQVQQKVMLYGLPLMIGVFAFQFPAAVSLYWAVSTVFAIGQQVVINRKT